MRPGFGSADLATPLAVDANALSALKQQAKASPKAALSAAATQFEAMFVQMLLKSMREALPQDGMLSSEQSKLYTSMFDQQIAQQMSKRGIGLSKVLERQLGPAMGAEEAKGDAASAAAGTLRRSMTSPTITTPAHATSATEGSIASKLPANVRAFVEKMRPHAEAAARVVGVPADLLLAQAGLETGWGKSQPKAADGGTSHNLFGIKAGQSWGGKVAVASTTEYVAGAFVRTVEKFRAYGSYAEAFQDFGKLITGNARYAKAVALTDDPVAYAKSLQQGGYATDPHYADKLVRAIRLVAGQGGTPSTTVAAAQEKPGTAVNLTLAAMHAGARSA